MVKKLIAGALSVVALVSVGAMGVSANNYHHCQPGTCDAYYRGSYLGLYANGKWGFVCSTKDDHQDSLKYISVTTYTYNASSKKYIEGPTVNSKSSKPTVISPDAVIDGSIAKVVYNGQIYRTSQETSGKLETYLIGSIRSGCPIK